LPGDVSLEGLPGEPHISATRISSSHPLSVYGHNGSM
jgi:hypothetical protein